MSKSIEDVWPYGLPERLNLQNAGGMVAAVYLDGERMDSVVELNHAEGWIRRWKPDGNGGYLFKSDSLPLEPIVQTLYGDVRVTFLNDL